MNPTNRTRALWLLVALVSVHMLITTALFLATGSLPNGLMVFTLVVFAVCALAAIYFIMTSPAPREQAERRVVDEPVAAEDAEPVVRVQVDDGEAERASAPGA